jgi:programmed cell death protein 4
VLGERDPNYDEYTDGVVLAEKAISADPTGEHAAILALLVEYVDSGDVVEALTELKEKAYIDASDFVADAIEFGLDHKSYERELVSQLLSAAHPVFEGKGYIEGFQKILYQLPDLALDTPDAAEFVGLFIARAIYDDTLAPVFIREAVVDNELAKLALSLAYNVYHEPAERSRLENIWGPSAQVSLEQLREEVNVILKEYMVSLDVSEADRAILALSSPSFMAQVVKQAVYLALESGNHKPRELMLGLLQQWQSSSIVPEFHMVRGFELARKGIDEIALDVPHAEQALLELEAEAVAKKILISA